MSAIRRLLLVRHGLPQYRIGQIEEIPPGPVLAGIGRMQARQAAEFLASFPIQRVYASPLTRAVQTAQFIAQLLRMPITLEQDHAEWHPSERLYDVDVRSGRWVRRWLAGGERCVVVVGHASPLLSIIREALYLPHARWWDPRRAAALREQSPAAARLHSNKPTRLNLDTADRFDVSMGSVFEVCFERSGVRARPVFHPEPRIMHTRAGRPTRYAPRPAMSPEGGELIRTNVAGLVGAHRRE
jgi:broad specificity phosphatase PhoE